VAEPGDVIQPAVDQFRQGDSHHAVVDLAGVSASEVALRIDDRDVVIQADRPTVTASADDIILAERPSGRFERRLRRPPDADLSTLTADCTDGVLHLAVGLVNTDGSPAGDQRTVDVGSGQRLASVDDSEKKT
jgi:HSP20 family protein